MRCAQSHVDVKRFLIAGQRGSCDISLSTGNVNISDYQPPLVCSSSVDLHWFISRSLRVNALFLLITFLYNFLTHAYNRNNYMMADFFLLFEKPHFNF
jgi:hypothetical protein